MKAAAAVHQRCPTSAFLRRIAYYTAVFLTSTCAVDMTAVACSNDLSTHAATPQHTNIQSPIFWSNSVCHMGTENSDVYLCTLPLLIQHHALVIICTPSSMPFATIPWHCTMGISKQQISTILPSAAMPVEEIISC